MTVFDLIVFGVFLSSAGLAYLRGALLELATLISLGFAWLVATQFGAPVANIVGSADSMITLIGSYIALIVITLMIVYIAFHIAYHRLPLSPRARTINKIVGAFFGLIRGYVLIGLCFLAYGYYLDEESQPDSVRNAVTLPIAISGATFFEQFIPDDTRFETTDNKTSLEGYNRDDRANLSEVITTVTTTTPEFESSKTKTTSRKNTDNDVSSKRPE